MTVLKSIALHLGTLVYLLAYVAIAAVGVMLLWRSELWKPGVVLDTLTDLVFERLLTSESLVSIGVILAFLIGALAAFSAIAWTGKKLRNVRRLRRLRGEIEPLSLRHAEGVEQLVRSYELYHLGPQIGTREYRRFLREIEYIRLRHEFEPARDQAQAELEDGLEEAQAQIRRLDTQLETTRQRFNETWKRLQKWEPTRVVRWSDTAISESGMVIHADGTQEISAVQPEIQIRVLHEEIERLQRLIRQETGKRSVDQVSD